MIRKIVILSLVLCCTVISAIAQGDLLITPTRVVFEGGKQKEELNLVNVGNDTAIYSASFVQYRMKEDGGFEQIEVPDSGQMFADPYLRMFPRRVTLAPREPQVISLQLRRKADMKEGEYRSHLYFRAEKDNKPLGLENEKQDTTVLKVQLIPVYGLSIPVIIRTGSVSMNAFLDDLSIVMERDTIPILKFYINRTGNISVYGDFKVEHYPANGKPYELAYIKGVGVYTNLSKRLVSILLTKSPDIPLSGGKIKVTYYTQSDNLRTVVITEQEMELK